MKQIDHSTLDTAGDSVLRKVQSSVQGALKIGGGDEELKAQEVFAQQIGRMLDNRYTLLRNIQLEGSDLPIPMILVGPQGVMVIKVSMEEGIFRAKETSWSVLDSRLEEYRSASTNLIMETLQLAETVDKFFLQAGIELPEPAPVLFMGHPGVHVDVNNPAVRVVRMDGVDSLSTAVISGKTILDSVQVQQIVDSLTQASEANRAVKKPEPAKDELDKLWKDDADSESAKSTAASSNFQLPPALQRLGLSNNQWIILAAMALGEICLIFVFILFILMAL
jgi:hypothetical protein